LMGGQRGLAPPGALPSSKRRPNPDTTPKAATRPRSASLPEWRANLTVPFGSPAAGGWHTTPSRSRVNSVDVSACRPGRTKPDRARSLIRARLAGRAPSPVPRALGRHHGRTGRRVTDGRVGVAPPAPPWNSTQHPKSDASQVSSTPRTDLSRAPHPAV